jgi:hypothetical protein
LAIFFILSLGKEMCNVYVYAAMALVSMVGANEASSAQAEELDETAKSYDFQAEDFDEKERIAKKEASLSEAQAMETSKIGDIEARKTLVGGKLVESSQRAAFGASGVRVDTGVATDVTEETQRLAYGDSVTIKANAERESFGFRLNAWKKRGEARTYAKDATNARRSAKASERAAKRVRGRSFLQVIGAGLGTASQYRG